MTRKAGVNRTAAAALQSADSSDSGVGTLGLQTPNCNLQESVYSVGQRANTLDYSRWGRVRVQETRGKTARLKSQLL